MTRNEFYLELGRRIRGKRKEAGLNQTQLANALGISSAGFICDVENGRRSLSVYKLHIIEQELGGIWPQSKCEECCL